MCRQQLTLGRLVAPARAAANQMKDAGMSRGADPLLQILFELDAIDSELHALVASDPAGVLEEIAKRFGVE